jgi:tRNA (guanosine-2'-O-)-methyltransferase
MGEQEKKVTKSNLRKRADAIKDFQCENLIAVIEEPTHLNNIGKVIRCVNTLGIKKLYVVDSKDRLPDNWNEMRKSKPLIRMSASAVKWSFVKKFKTTTECLDHLEKNKFVSIATSPHQIGKKNVVLHEGDFTQKRLAVWFGSESNGLSEEVINRSEACVNIEMYGIIESMNVSSSAAIVLYEITKQRRAWQKLNAVSDSNQGEPSME